MSARGMVTIKPNQLGVFKAENIKEVWIGGID